MNTDLTIEELQEIKQRAVGVPIPGYSPLIVILCDGQIATMQREAKLRDALRPFAAWPIVADGRIVETDKNWNDLITQARAAFYASDY